ncbi:MAG: hypothetical protein GY891_11750, partial [Bacteroidetes bacterium]|nr:hypothetical protein [Bacteroidota bacterium]
EGTDYPNLMYVHGHIPDEAPVKEFSADDIDNLDDFNEGIDVDGYDNLDFDENWN